MKQIPFISGMVGLCLLFLSGCSREEKRPEPSLDFYEELHKVNRLELGRMTISKVGMITDPGPVRGGGIFGRAESLLNSLKIGTRLGVYSYDTYQIAYIDLNRLQPGDITVDEEIKKVYVSLPPVELTTDGREVEFHEEHYRVTGLRSSITPGERARLKEKMGAEVRKEIAANTRGDSLLRKTAEKKAVGWVSQFVRTLGYDAEVKIAK